MSKFLAWTSLLTLWAFASMAQAQNSACLNELVPCLQYINSKKTPSSSCCDPLKLLIRSNPECLCSMLGSSTTKQAGVNMTRAQLLPKRCGEKVTASMCSSLAKMKKKGSSSSTGFATPNGLVACLLILLVPTVLMSIV